MGQDKDNIISAEKLFMQAEQTKEFIYRFSEGMFTDTSWNRASSFVNLLVKAISITRNITPPFSPDFNDKLDNMGHSFC